MYRIIIPIALFASIAHASINLYGVSNAPLQPNTVIALTEYSEENGEAEPYPLNTLRLDRVGVDAHGLVTVAYKLGAFHSLDGPEDVQVHCALADIVATATRVRWIEFPASTSRTPARICFDIRTDAFGSRTIETSDTFGAQLLRISRPETLCVPATIGILGDPYYYYPAYGVSFPPPPDVPARLCFKARPLRPVVRPEPVLVPSFFGKVLATLQPVREHCVDATVN